MGYLGRGIAGPFSRLPIRNSDINFEVATPDPAITSARASCLGESTNYFNFPGNTILKIFLEY